MVHSTRLGGRVLRAGVALAVSAVACAPSVRANDVCAVANGAQNCQGDQSAGIGLTAPPAPGTLNVFNLSKPIAPSTPGPGIGLQSTQGSDLTVNSGTAQSSVSIVGTQAPGIAVSSQGIAQVPPVQQYDPLLNVPIPGSAGVSGGVVTVNSYGDITTSGASAHGISAQSSTPGYDPALVGILQQFSANGIHFQVTSVAGGAAGTAVSGQVATQDANGLWVPSGTTAGTLTINADGSFSVNTGAGFGNLAVGAAETITANYTLDGYRGTDLKASGVQGVLWVRVEMTTSGPSIVAEGATFSSYGFVSLSPTATSPTALPDLQSYVNSLIAKANGSGGAGNSVTVNRPIGTIKTQGGQSYGIYAESQGAAGAPGGAGGGFFSSTAPTIGGTGYAGGPVTVTLGGSVITEGQSSLGVFAHSTGGDGGPGGDGGTWHDGRQGGTGGSGGAIHVSGNGTITTSLDSATGIYALSEGGDGGVGGEGHGAFNGGAGGFGGKGGTVDVEGSWTITTSGNSAYGIWAKSVGGNAGSGGSGGWLAGEPGSGGQASDGGSVTLASGGKITTHGSDAYGLYAQSVGGFGGSGGSGGSIFYSRGGDANSAGSGGMSR